MAEATDTNRQIIQNLKDAGCPDEFVSAFMQLCQDGRGKDQLHLLSGHRKELLNAVHKNQKRIDCLDYLIHKLKL